MNSPSAYESVSESSSKSENNVITVASSTTDEKDTSSNDKTVSSHNNDNSAKEIEPLKIDYFKSSFGNEEINPGETVELSWSISGATDVTIDNGLGSFSSVDSVKVNPEEDTTYIITATNGVETTEETVTVYVKEIEPTTSDSSEADSEYFASEENTEPY